MRDIIWTLIVVWLVYKVVDLFKATTRKKNVSQAGNTTASNPSNGTSSPQRDLKGVLRKHLNNEGEYVDFEEVK